MLFNIVILRMLRHFVESISQYLSRIKIANHAILYKGRKRFWAKSVNIAFLRLVLNFS